MAKEIIARGQISIIDLNDAKSLNMYLKANRPTTQIYNTDNVSFVPDWTKENLIIEPELYVSGTTSNQITQVKAKPTYKINGKEPSAYGGVVAPTPPYRLTINQNMAEPQMRVECTAIYTDPDVASLETTVKADIQFTKTTNAGSTICAIAYTPHGNVFKNDQTSELSVHCDMWRGSHIDSEDVSYKWFKMGSDGQWIQLTQEHAFGCRGWDKTGYEAAELFIPASAVLNFETFKCEITDTDEKSGTHNTTVSDIVSFVDQSDPYYVEVYSTTGDKILNGVGSTTLTAKVWQAGACYDTEDANAKFTFKWKKFKATGELDPNWGTSGSKEGASITVTASEVTQKATFVCELYSK